MPTGSEKSIKVTSDEFIIKENDKFAKPSKKTEPSFYSDFLPMFHPSLTFILSYVVYYNTGNPLLVSYIAMLCRPLYDLILWNDHSNVDKKYEKVFQNYQIMTIPVYLYIILNFLVWLWLIAINSTGYKPDHWLFQINPPETLG